MKQEEFKTNIPKEFIQKEAGNNNFFIVVIAVLAIVGVVYFFNYNKPTPKAIEKPQKGISIYEYHNMETRCSYLEYKNSINEVIIHDLLLKKGVKLDSAYLMSIGYHVSNLLKDPKCVPYSIMTPEWKENSTNKLDSLCANWLESIPFMVMMDKKFGGGKFDSTQVLNSESYKTMKADILDKLREKKMEIYNGKMPKMP